MILGLDAPAITDHSFCDRHHTVRATSSATFSHWDEVDQELKVTGLFFCGNCFWKAREKIMESAISINDEGWRSNG